MSSEVCGPRTTSTHFITSAGLKKCMLHTRSGRPVASAIRDETMLEELVARIACGGRRRSRSANTSRLTSSFSTAASITKSARGRGGVQVGAERQPAERGVHLVAGAPALLDVAGHPLPQLRSGAVQRVLARVGDGRVDSRPARRPSPICEPIAPAPTTRISCTSSMLGCRRDHRPWKTGGAWPGTRRRPRPCRRWCRAGPARAVRRPARCAGRRPSRPGSPAWPAAPRAVPWP